MSHSTADDFDIARTLGGASDGDAIRVLHVDDDPDFAELVSIYLERSEGTLEVETEHSAEAALDRLSAADFDCVVSDYDMPGMDGLALLDAVRDEYTDLPFILYTGQGSEEIASEAISAGVTDYLQKESGTDQYTVLANRILNATERFRVERAVENGFHAIETAREGISFLDEEGTFIYVNEAYADTYGYEPAELVGNHWETLYPDDHVSQVYEELLPVVPESGRWSGESVHVHADGRRLVVDHALAYTDEGLLVCLIDDITERKETEQALERERQRFEQFVEAVEEYAIFALDQDGFVTSWNTGAERIKGYSESEIVGEHVSTFYPEEKRAADYPAELLERALTEGTAEDTGWRLRADGSKFWAHVVITAVFDEDGDHRGFLKVTRDATDQLEADRTAQTDDAFLEGALDAMEDVFFVLDATGRVKFVSETAVEVTGTERATLLSERPTSLFEPGDRSRVRSAIDETLSTGNATLEATLTTGDGGTRPYEFRARRFAVEGTEFVAGVGRDVRERKCRERQLTRQLEQFEQFGNVLSHDLQTPLGTARGRLELVRQTGDTAHVEGAERALDRLETLVDDLADVLREGALVRDRSTVDLDETSQSVWGTVSAPGATLRTPDELTVEADPDALARLLENLFKNALDHGGESVTVTVGALEDGFYVADDGPGLPEGDAERVFEAGYSTKDDGEGFGLASVHQVVVAHGWTVSATASETGGARFEITGVDRPE